MSIFNRVTSQPQPAAKTQTVRIWRAGLAAAVLAPIANLIVFFFTTAYLGAALEVFTRGPGSPMQPLPASMVVVITVLAVTGATILFAVLNRFSARPLTAFYWICGIVLLVSFAAPFSLPGQLLARLALASMHLITAFVVIVLFTRKMER